MKRSNNIRLSQEILVQVPSLQEYLNTKLLLVLQVFKATCSRIWFVAISILARILQLNKKSKGKEKDINIQVFVVYFIKCCWFFSHCLSVGLVLNRGTLAATALCETYNISILKLQSICCFFPNIYTMDSCRVNRINSYASNSCIIHFSLCHFITQRLCF